MLDNACFEVFHTDTGNKLRNKSYEGILNSMSFLPRLGSPTMYFNTADKAADCGPVHSAVAGAIDSSCDDRAGRVCAECNATNHPVRETDDWNGGVAV